MAQKKALDTKQNKGKGKGRAFAFPDRSGKSFAPEKLFDRVSQPFKTAFGAACLFGVITHIYIFTNLLLNHDSVWRLFYDNNNLTSGRWALQWLSEFSTRFQLPVVIAVISILMLSLAAGLTVSVLEISSRATAVLTGAFVVTFPSVACIFSYLFTADAYFICLFLNTLAVYLTKKYQWGWLPGILLCAVACGGYQAFICYAIGLFLIDCILELLRGVPVREVLRKGGKYIAVSVAALVLYYLILMLLLQVKGLSLTAYQGLDSITGFQIGTMLAQLPNTYGNFAQYFLATPFSNWFFRAVQVLFLLLSLGALISLVMVRRLYRDWPRMALLTVGIVLLPLALNFITVLSAGSWVHALMIYSFVLLDILALKLMEDAPLCTAASWLNIVLAGLLIWNNFCVSNIAYLRLQVSYENSYATANRIVARIESLDGYSPDLPVALVGTISKQYGGSTSAFSQLNSMTGIDGKLLYTSDPHIRTREFIEDYIGLQMPKPSKEQKALIADCDFVKELPCYPQAGSITLYEGVIVVKLSEGGEIR